MTDKQDTPRTDAEYERIYHGNCLPGCDSYGHEENCPVCWDFRLMADFARQLERELDALRANLEAVAVERDNAKAERGTLMAFPDENGETVWTPLGDDIRRIDRARKQAEERATEAEAKLAAERDKALEDAAEVCATKWIPNAIYTGATLTEIEIEGSYNNAVTDCIGAIRALKSAGKS